MLEIAVVLISFFLDSIVSMFVPIDTNFFVPLFSIVSLIIIYPYFNHREGDYMKMACVLGLCYDFIYTDTLFLHCMLFFVLAQVIRLLNVWFSNNVISVSFMSIIIIVVYRMLEYGILCLIGFLPFDMEFFLKGIYASLLLNVIYCVIVYLITDWVSRKYRILKID